MTRFNPLNFKPLPEPVPATRDFADAAQPGDLFTITLRGLHPNLKSHANDLAGRWYHSPPGAAPLYQQFTLPAATFDVLPGGVRVPRSMELCRMVSTLELAEVAPDGEAPYTRQEWLALAVYAPDAFAGMVLFQSELQDAYQAVLYPQNRDL